MLFPDDFKMTDHPVVIGAVQFKATKKSGTTISIVGGGMGLYGGGVATFEMWDFDEEEPRGHMSKEEINNHIKDMQWADCTY